MQDVSNGAGGQGWNATAAQEQELKRGEPPVPTNASPPRPEEKGEPSSPDNLVVIERLR